MKVVSYPELRGALVRGLVVHICVRVANENAFTYEATYQEDDNPTTSTSVCSLRLDQYDELLAMGAVEDGLLLAR